MIRKGFLSIALGSLLFSGLQAREGGALVGVGGFFGFDGWIRWQDSSVSQKQRFGGLGGSGDILLGYEAIFAKWFGIRTYASFEYGSFFFDGLNDLLEAKRTNLFDAALNLDLLFDFVSRDSFSLGLFVGVSGGMHYWYGPLINGLQDKTTRRLFGSVGLNTGFSFGIASNHALDVLVKISFLEDLVLRQGLQVGISKPYMVGLRYIYSFGGGSF